MANEQTGNDLSTVASQLEWMKQKIIEETDESDRKKMSKKINKFMEEQQKEGKLPLGTEVKAVWWCLHDHWLQALDAEKKRTKDVKNASWLGKGKAKQAYEEADETAVLWGRLRSAGAVHDKYVERKRKWGRAEGRKWC